MSFAVEEDPDSARVERPLPAHLVTSPSDYADEGMRRFVRFADGHPHLRVTLHEGSYERHGGVRYEFFATLRRVVGPA
jgi:hypothetical protein